MAGCVLLWALPDSWLQFDLLAPDLDTRITQQLRERLGGSGADETQLEQLIALQIGAARGALEEGVILWAAYGEGESSTGLPAGLSLTLALANLPGSPDATASPGQGSASGGASAFASSVTPLTLDDTDLTAFTKESRSEIEAPGTGLQLTQFQVQAFVVPADQPGMAVATVTTFDPEWEDRARTAARAFANTLLFVSVDADIDEPVPGQHPEES